MIFPVEVTAWQCTVCGWQWFPRGNVKPTRCPKRSCRKLSNVEMVAQNLGMTEKDFAEKYVRPAIAQGLHESAAKLAVKISDEDVSELPWQEVNKAPKVYFDRPKRCKHGFTRCAPCKLV